MTRALLAGLLCLCLALALLSCSDAAEPTPASTSPVSATQPAATKGAIETRPTSPASAGQLANEPVALQAPDGVTLRGHLYTVPGPARKVLLLVSSVEQSTWRAHVSELVAPGVALMTLDPRGVGETAGSSDAARDASDIALAIAYLKSRDYPQIYVLGVGAPLAAAAFRAAGQQDVSGVAGLPAGGNTPQEIASVSEPKLFIAFENDAESLAAIDRLMQAAPDPKQKLILPSNQQPTRDVLAIPAVVQALLRFMGL